MRVFSTFCIWTLFVAAIPSSFLSAEEACLEESLFLRRIADFWQEGEYSIAKNQMGEFLGTYADSSYANTLRMTLGDLFIREKNFQEAINCYSQISDPVLVDQVFIRRMQCLYHLQWHATLADECEAYLQRTQEQNNEAERLEATHLLAIALYEQCNHQSLSEADVQIIAERAKPYFETLSKSPLSNEVAGAFAHLRCLLKDFKGASQIYLDLASQANCPDDLLFQAALLQSKYDKVLSIQTFEEISKQGGKFAGEAAYNRLILCFDLDRHEDITLNEERILQSVPNEKIGFAHLIIGQSYLALGKCNEAASEFNVFLQSDLPTKSIGPALLQIIEAAYRTDDLALLDLSVEKWTKLDPEDPNLATASFTRAQILKKEGRLEEAKKEISTLLARFPQFENRPEAAYNLIQLEASAERPAAYREAALFFIQQYPTHKLTPSAWHHLAFASSQLALSSKELTEQLIRDLEAFLANEDFLSPAENCDLQFRLAKAYFDLGAIQEALNLLEPICNAESALFDAKGDAELLFAICGREGLKNLPLFCEWAELALLHKATLLSEAEQHLALFNAYLFLTPESTDVLADHLLASFSLQAKIELPNLLWLANYTYEQFEKDPLFAEKALNVAASILKREDIDSKNIQPDTLVLEQLILRHAKLLQHCKQPNESIEWLESLDAQYRRAPELGWHYISEARFVLAESLLATGSLQLAESLFDTIAGATILRDKFAAAAALQSARIKQASPDPNSAQILSMLKNISIQKTLANEPIHLEAAIDYIDLLASLQIPENRAEKSLDLLTKTKANFEAQDDLLSKDYHAARTQSAQQNQIYLDYMLYLNAKILLAKAEIEVNEEQQKELKANAKELLLQISENRSVYLQRRLDQIEAGA